MPTWWLTVKFNNWLLSNGACIGLAKKLAWGEGCYGNLLKYVPIEAHSANYSDVNVLSDVI